MAKDLISSQLRRTFQDSYVRHAVLRDIEYDFGDAGLSATKVRGLEDGERRDLVARFYFPVKWSDPVEARKVIAAYESHLSRLEDRESGDELARLKRALKRAGFAYKDGLIATPTWFPAVDGDTEDDGGDLWEPEHFRLFVSHVSTFKGKATLLRQELKRFQISCFVAHEDIQPSREWLVEIQRALKSMDALTALLSEGFHSSNWTDQEIGFALGRGVHVVSVIRDLDPYGFIGVNQGIVGRHKKIPDVAQAIFQDLATHPQTRPRMAELIARRLARSGSWDAARRDMTLLESTGVHSEPERDYLEEAFYGNSEIRESFGVRGRLEALLGRSLALQDDEDQQEA